MPVVFNPFTGNLDLIDNTAAAGSDTQVQFNDGGVLGGDGGLVFNKTTNALTGGAFIPTSSTVPTNGVYLPGANQLALSTNGTGRLFINSTGDIQVGAASTLNAAVLSATANAASKNLYIAFNSTTTGVDFLMGGISAHANSVNIGAVDIYRGSSDNHGYISFRTKDGTTLAERLRITADGKVGIGTSALSKKVEIANGDVRLTDGYTISWGDDAWRIFRNGSQLRFDANGTQALTIDSSQRVGIGVTVPSSFDAEANQLVVGSGAGDQGITIYTGSSASDHGSIFFADGTTGGAVKKGQIRYEQNNEVMSFWTNETERCRIDLSGRLLVGTSSSTSIATREASIQVSSDALAPNLFSALNVRADQYGASIVLAKSRGGASPAVQANDTLGSIIFSGHDGTDLNSAGAYIVAAVDGAVSNDDLPTRLVFSVTADGAASPTEALRISSNRAITVSDGGNVVLGTTTGTKIGTSTSQKIGFFDETPIVQPTTGIAEAAFVENSGGTAVNVDSTFGGYTIQQVVQALQSLGLLA